MRYFSNDTNSIFSLLPHSCFLHCLIWSFFSFFLMLVSLMPALAFQSLRPSLPSSKREGQAQRMESSSSPTPPSCLVTDSGLKTQIFCPPIYQGLIVPTSCLHPHLSDQRLERGKRLLFGAVIIGHFLVTCHSYGVVPDFLGTFSRSSLFRPNLQSSFPPLRQQPRVQPASTLA